MVPHDILWSLPPSQCPLAVTDVHVWAARLGPGLEALARLSAILSREERERAARYLL